MFDKQSCFIYEVENSGFINSPACGQEFISPNAASVVNVTKVEDVTAYLNEKIKTKELNIVPYVADAKVEKKNKQTVKELLLIEKDKEKNLDESQLPKFVKAHYADVIEEINKK